MTADPDISCKPPRWLALAVVCALAINTFVLLVVNYFIYWARAQFIATHPDYVAKHPPTISRALSDPLIGEPFAFWVSLCAGLLFVGVVIIVTLIVFAARDMRSIAPRTARFIMRCAYTALTLQVGASIGMVVLSQYRMGADSETHMIGSYLFFFAQGFVVLTGLVLSSRLLRDKTVHNQMRSSAYLALPAMQARVIIGWISVVLAFSYLILFVIKDVTFPVGNEAIYQAYVWTEPAVITSFLMFLTVFHVDFIMMLRHYRSTQAGARARGQLVSGT